jgi:hypothetical protein
MATGISNAERLPDGDYSVSHRPPPPVPSANAYTHTYNTTTHAHTTADDPSLLSAAAAHGTGEAASTHSSERPHRRRGSFSSLLRRSSSQQSNSRAPQPGSGGEEVPPVPSLPATRIGQAHQAAALAQHNRDTSYSSSRKGSSEGGRNMLRKSSKLKQQERERLEQERIARQNAPAPQLQGLSPLPNIKGFGGEDNSNNPNTANFSRPYGSNMPASGYNSSSSPAYAVRGGVSPAVGKDSGEYVERHESMTNRGRYSYASSTVGVNVSSPRRVRRRKDPTPFK